MAYAIELSLPARERLKLLRPFDRKILVHAIRRRLAIEPTRQTRNRFRMRKNPLAPSHGAVGAQDLVDDSLWLEIDNFAGAD